MRTGLACFFPVALRHLCLSQGRFMAINILRASNPLMVMVTLLSLLLMVATAISEGAEFNLFHVLLLGFGVVLTHVSFNLFCCFHDLKSGFAARAAAMPFSASVAMPEQAANSIKRGAQLTLFLALLCGGYFVVTVGYGLLLPILFVTLMILLYHSWLMVRPHINLIIPGLVVGPILGLSSYYALTGIYSYDALYVSLASFFLVSNLFLLAQYPNWQLNRELGRFYFPVMYGTKRSSVVYVVFILGVLYVIGMGDIIGLLPEPAPWAMLPMGLAVYAVVGGFKYGSDGEKLRPHLWANWAATIMTTLMLAILILL